MGIDYGKVRIGLAVSDDLGLFAHPLQTISGKSQDHPVDVINRLIGDRGIRQLVVGMPLHASGDESRISREVRGFISALRESLGPDFPIHEMDELMTTRTAREKLIEAGTKKSRLPEILDQAAAVEILQSWLNQRLPPADPYDPEGD